MHRRLQPYVCEGLHPHRSQVAFTGSAATLRDLHDKSLSSGVFLVELLAAVEPRCVDRALVTPGVTEERQPVGRGLPAAPQLSSPASANGPAGFGGCSTHSTL